jgi:uncharacterized membrane protein (UPF0127 family)
MIFNPKFINVKFFNDNHCAKFALVIFIFLTLSVSCARAADKDEIKSAQKTLRVKDLTITTAAGKEIIVRAELAKSAEEQRAGLMFRKTLSDGEGMIFIFPSDRVLSFWMKNTLLPLSIADIGRDGVIAEIHDMEPRSTRAIQSSRSLRYALEVPAGWFTKAGIAPGDKIDISF